MRKLQALVILVILFGLAAPAQAQDTIDLRNKLEACWGLDEENGTRYDAANSYNATDVNTVGRGLGVNSNHSYSAAFVAANNEYLDVGDNLDFIETSFTIMTWATLKTQTTTAEIVTKNGSGQYGLVAYTTPRIRFNVAGNGESDITISSPVPDWNYVLAYFDYPNRKSYLNINNLQFDSSTTTIASPSNMVTTLKLGYQHTGNLDTTAIWSRLLNNSEMEWIYNDGLGRNCSEILDTTGYIYCPPDDYYSTCLFLSSGDRANIYRNLTYGDIGVVTAILALFSLELVRLLFKLVQRNTREN